MHPLSTTSADVLHVALALNALTGSGFISLYPRATFKFATGVMINDHLLGAPAHQFLLGQRAFTVHRQWSDAARGYDLVGPRRFADSLCWVIPAEATGVRLTWNEPWHLLGNSWSLSPIRVATVFNQAGYSTRDFLRLNITVVQHGLFTRSYVAAPLFAVAIGKLVNYTVAWDAEHPQHAKLNVDFSW